MKMVLEFFNPFINLTMKNNNSHDQPLFAISPIDSGNKYNGLFLFTIVYKHGLGIEDDHLKIIGVDDV
jgi:hypothetical protein